MTMPARLAIVVLILAYIGTIYALKATNATRYTNISGSGQESTKVRLVDYGSKPCKCQAKPQLYERLEAEYVDQVLFEYVDVLTATHNGIRTIPSQIVYDKEYREIARHEGPPTEEAISRLITDSIQQLATEE